MNGFCVDCKKKIGKEHTRCYQCDLEYRHKKKRVRTCKDCGKQVGWGSLRCSECNYRHMYGEKRVWKCQICGANTSEGHTRCRKCCIKAGVFSPGVGRNHHSYKEPSCCIDCGKQLRYRFSKRCRSCEAKRKHREKVLNMKGSANPAWLDGRSYEPYASEWGQKKRDAVRKRDEYVCQNQSCSMTEEEHLIVVGQNLHVHHIDYDKKNCSDMNLISLCLWCNNRANYNREYWKAYYQKRMEEKNVKNKM